MRVIDEHQRWASKADAYLEALLRLDRDLAHRLILDAVAGGVSVEDIYVHVLQRSLYELGRLWELNRVTVAQEHYCTAATQLIMCQLYPMICSTQKQGRAMIATCVGGELHEIGVRMLADLLELNGWDTHYLGANTPTPSLLRLIEDYPVDLLAISATLTAHIDMVAAMIGALRTSEAGRRVKVLVGGQAFNADRTLWRAIGADGYAADGREGVMLANRLVAT